MKSFKYDRPCITIEDKAPKRCWHCNYHTTSSKSIQNEKGCCLRCGTNLNKKLIKPILDNALLSKEVLGTRFPCKIIVDDNGQTITMSRTEKAYLESKMHVPREEALNKYGISSSSASFKENILNKSVARKGKLRPNKEKYEGWNYAL